MEEKRRADRILILNQFRNNALRHGGDLGDLISKAHDLMFIVVEATTADYPNIDRRIASLLTEQKSAMHERNVPRNEPQNLLLYDLVEAIAMTIESVLEEKGCSFPVATGLQPDRVLLAQQGLLMLQRPQQQQSSSSSSAHSPDSVLGEQIGASLPHGGQEVPLFQDLPPARAIKMEPMERDSSPDIMEVEIGPGERSKASFRNKEDWLNFGMPTLPKKKKDAEKSGESSGASRDQASQQLQHVIRTSSTAQLLTGPCTSQLRSASVMPAPSSSRASVIPAQSASKRAVMEEGEVDVNEQESPLKYSLTFGFKRARMEEPESALEPYNAPRRKALSRARSYMPTQRNYDESDDDEEEEMRSVDTAAAGGSSIFACYKCEKQFNSHEALSKHDYRRHVLSEGEADVSDVESEVADVRARREQQLRQEAKARRAMSMGRVAFATPTVSAARPLRAGTLAPSSAPATAKGSGPFRCLIAGCGRSFPSHKGLVTHGMLHTGEPCPVCHKRMAADRIARHLIEKHDRYPRLNTGSAPAKKAATPAAQAARKIRAGTAAPAITSASSGKGGDVPCSETDCPRTFECEKGMRRHVAHAHSHGARAQSVFTSPSKEGWAVCPEEGCYVQRQNKAQIAYHLREVHGILPYECDQCGEKFEKKGPLSAHRKAAH